MIGRSSLPIALRVVHSTAAPHVSPTRETVAMVSQADIHLDRVLALGAKAACLTHFGEVRDLEEVASQLRVWIDRAERWLDDATRSDESAEVITGRLMNAWRDAVAETSDARGLGFDEAAYRHLAMDIELNAQGIASVAIARRKRAST